MDAFSLIVTILLGLSLVVFIVSLFLAIIFNVRIGIKYRDSLAKKLHTLRLSKMLSALGIDTTEYLYKERIVTIRQQMDRCSECVNTEECDNDLSNDNLAVEEIDYCNNESSLKDMLSKKKRVVE